MYKDSDFVTQYTGTAIDQAGSTIANRLCCLAYDQDSEINNSLELTFACEEILVEDLTPLYDPESMTCQIER